MSWIALYISLMNVPLITFTKFPVPGVRTGTFRSHVNSHRETTVWFLNLILKTALDVFRALACDGAWLKHAMISMHSLLFASLCLWNNLNEMLDLLKPIEKTHSLQWNGISFVVFCLYLTLLFKCTGMEHKAEEKRKY